MSIFNPDKAAQILAMMSPVVQLNTLNRRMLETGDYMVGPKADGERAMLLFQSATNSFYLIRQSCSPILIKGTYTGPNIEEGFILDTEVVVTSSGLQLILAFDVCKLGRCAELEINSHSIFQRYTSFSQRHKVLKAILQSVLMPNLRLKPIAPSHQAESMWKVWQHCPYPIDGLIFTQNQYGGSAIKWKPPSNLTLDIALGEPIEKNNIDSCFIAHFYDFHDDHDLDESNDDLNNSVDDIVSAIGHKPFWTLVDRHISDKSNVQSNDLDKSSTRGQEEDTGDNGDINRIEAKWHELKQTTERNGLGQTYRYDLEGIELDRSRNDAIENIQTERLAETLGWTKGSTRCQKGKKSCPCHTNLGHGRKFLHCVKCGTLGVGAETLSCQVTCSYPKQCVVWLPAKHVEWSRHSVVEMELVRVGNIDESRFEFRFKRIRRDKKRANSFSVANTILQEFLQPTQLCDINFKLPPVGTLLGLREHKSYRLPKHVHKSNFTKLRKVHYQIKGWLYETFGGTSIIDACSGALHDLHNWTEANIASVLAIDNDEYLYQEGLVTIQHRSDKKDEPLPRVLLKQGDLSNPFDLSTIDMLSNPVDSVFCNFAIHYFWGSEEKTSVFLDNLLPHLVEGGRVIATFVDGDKLHGKGSFKVFSDENLLEFEVKMVNEKTISIYVASIGVQHIESIITRGELQERFKRAGLDFVSWLPFEVLRNLSTEELSEGEIEMSNLYVAAIFEKHSTCTLPPTPTEKTMTKGVLLSDRLPYIEREILRYFSIPDLVKCRLLSNEWRREIDTMEIESSVKDACFRDIAGTDKEKKVCYGGDGFKYKSAGFEIDLSPRSVALFMQMGGTVTKSVSHRISDYSDHSLCDPYDPYEFFDYYQDDYLGDYDDY